MTWGELAQILTAVGAILAALLSFINGRKLNVVKDATNGMKDELVKHVRQAALVEGVQRGKEEAQKDK